MSEQISPIDRQESEKSPVMTIQPATDLMLKGEIGSTPLPPEITHNPDLLEQAKKRLELSSLLNEVLSQIPDPSMDIQEALDKGLTEPEGLVQLYQGLGEFLETDENNARLVLYLPIELLPGKNDAQKPEILSQSENQFKAIYLENWQKLLQEEDVRANFVDGEIVEQELRSGLPPIVVKAAHLIPQLVKKGFISVSDIEKMAQDAESDILYDSIMDTIPVLADLNLIDEYHPLVTEALRTRSEIPPKEEKQGPKDTEITLREFYQKLEGLDTWYAKRKVEPGVTPARADWEKIDKRQKIIARMAEDISHDIKADIPIDSISDQVKLEAKLALTLGIRVAVEELADQDLEGSKTKAQEFKSILLKLWYQDNKELKDALTTTWSHWAQLGVIEGSFLAQLGIEVPNMETPFGLEQEIQGLESAISAIKNDPELKERIYPIILLFGSRLKGYADRSADLDIALFVRPETDVSDRDFIIGRVRQLFPDQDEVAKIVEFYLALHDGKLQVRDDVPEARTVAEKDWAHVLFGGVWVGDTEELKDVYQELMPGYFETADETYYRDYNNRAHWLREMEREVLQYRLMHRGYERYFPRRGGIETEHSSSIDSGSAFYDPGFRRLATKLFINKVFFPKLSK